ncbi:sensor histidine kinase [Sinomonas sp. JGH33]|uniref:histidine kinase n=1 Tax=Sinomonas terricola TaxID=3110330 RepID=A0ABU5T999_9MICC|nr:sensor histidine kinase [Sinomonas sp. JGH33]MEA5456272.1 sensor histidine kinase [Sinomonas sp. JGH33]
MRASGEDHAGHRATWPAPGPWSGGWRPRRAPWSLRVAAAVVLALIQIVGTHVAALRQPEARPLDALAVILLAAGPGLLLLLRLWPGPAATAIVAVTLGYFALGYPWGPILVSPVLALVWATAARARRWTWTVGGALVVAAGAVAIASGEWIRAAAVAAWTVVVLLVGEGLRVRRERVAERRREWEARRREARDQERLELARDIHDVVAHSLSLINVRASVALHLADRRPEELRPALEAIKEASHEALGEVRELLGVLRQDVPVTPGEPLERIPSLVEDARGLGLEATLDVRLDPPPSPALQRVAYRVVQEALTNAVRHAGAHRVSVRLAREGGSVVVDIHDDGAGLRGAAPGSGLRGMRERVEAAGGRLELADDGGLHVRAELPEARQAGGGVA